MTTIQLGRNDFRRRNESSCGMNTSAVFLSRIAAQLRTDHPIAKDDAAADRGQGPPPDITLSRRPFCRTRCGFFNTYEEAAAQGLLQWKKRLQHRDFLQRLHTWRGSFLPENTMRAAKCKVSPVTLCFQSLNSPKQQPKQKHIPVIA